MNYSSGATCYAGSNNEGVTTTLIERLRSQKPSVGDLDLSLCNINRVPLAAIKENFGQPTCLDLSFNAIRLLSKQFAVEMTRVTKLDLSRNELKKLPDNFGALKQLVYLDIHQNQLETLPLSMGRLTCLQFLALSNNPFRGPMQEIVDNAGNEVSGVTMARLVVLVMQQLEAFQAKKFREADKIQGRPRRRKSRIRHTLPKAFDHTPTPVISKSNANTDQESLVKGISGTKIEEALMKVEQSLRQYEIDASNNNPIDFVETDNGFGAEENLDIIDENVPTSEHAHYLSRLLALLSWIILIPLFTACITEIPYLENLAQVHPAFGEYWTRFSSFKHFAPYVPQYLSLSDSAWVLRGPPTSDAGMGFWGMILDVIDSIGELFTYMWNYITTP